MNCARPMYARSKSLPAPSLYPSCTLPAPSLHPSCTLFSCDQMQSDAVKCSQMQSSLSYFLFFFKCSQRQSAYPTRTPGKPVFQGELFGCSVSFCGSCTALEGPCGSLAHIPAVYCKNEAHAHGKKKTLMVVIRLFRYRGGHWSDTGLVCVTLRWCSTCVHSNSISLVPSSRPFPRLPAPLFPVPALCAAMPGLTHGTARGAHCGA